MRIALDAMGGDRAPAAPVEGALSALAAFPDVEVVLVGIADLVEAELGRLGAGADVRRRLPLEAADHVAGMEEDPVRAVTHHPGNSARRCAELLRDGAVGGVVNLGSTGVAVAAAHLYVGRLEGVRRPGIAVPFPRPSGATTVVDCGANPEAKAEDLWQYAVMATLYVRSALGIQRPRIGILSIGEEEHKGNRLVRETWALMRQRPLPDFVGNVEPREFFSDRADVVVADGFAGNVALKAAEGMAEHVLGAVGEAVQRGECGRAILDRVRRRIDYAEYGGAPLLGVKGAYVVGHGRSGAHAVHNAIGAARAYVAHRVGEKAASVLAGAAAGGPGEEGRAG